MTKQINPILFLIPLLLISAGCTFQNDQSQQVIRPVKVFQVGNPAGEMIMNFSGEVRTRYESILSFRVPGKIIERKVEIGSRVKKGQLLARLDPTDFRLATENFKAQLAAAKTDRDFAYDNFIRYRELLEQNIISPAEFDRQKTTYTTANERVRMLEAQLAQAMNQLDYTQLKSDRDGVITEIDIEAGQFVSAGQTVLRVAQLDEKEIYIDIPEHRIDSIQPDQEVSVILWSDSNIKIKGRIREIAPTANSASRTFRVKIKLTAGHERVHPGMTARVEIPIASRDSHQAAIPLSAIFTPQHEPAQSHVWIVDTDTQKVRLQPVRVGKTLSNDLMAVSGLAAGELIVSAGVQRLVEGQTVRVLDNADKHGL